MFLDKSEFYNITIDDSLHKNFLMEITSMLGDAQRSGKINSRILFQGNKYMGYFNIRSMIKTGKDKVS